MAKNYLSFAEFVSASRSRRVVRRDGTVRLAGRRFIDEALVSRVGQTVELFVDPTGINGTQAVCFDNRGAFITLAREENPYVARRL